MRALLGDGTIPADVLRRMDPALAAAGDPATWSPVAEARVRVAAAVALKAVHTKLSATPDLPWDEAAQLDVLLGQSWVEDIMRRVRPSERAVSAFRLPTGDGVQP
ncbi:hypothetical protein Q9S36_03095 [Microbacterium sp. ARD31]|uniref:hypothetical protein n=1 Tax=Microbacterium sp. ARD31 TaxID=2962576 RepID=UPI0028814895|nr:hypothetical protein [Microbacterium sp. ARD31]MDT0179194.1 hypothetical protein [Microbacterium sp. ARD31]